jgi:hypothetical protein
LLAFLRHQHSLYNERLRARCEYDKDFRDTLAAQTDGRDLQSSGCSRSVSLERRSSAVLIKVVPL